MRKITEIIIHCSATPQGRHHTVEDLDRWHRQQGFTQIGYHYVIYLDGTVHEGRPISEPGAHCTGHNQHSIGICYIGGYDKSFEPCDTRTPEQRQALRELVETLQQQYPEATVHGHSEFADKSCPCFRVPDEL